VAVTTFTGTQNVAAAIQSASTTSTSTAQAVASTQDAQVVANVAQSDPLNQSVITAGESEGLAQTNTLAATAIAYVSDDSIQTVAQQQSGTNDGASHSLSAAQWIETVQIADAGVAATQSRAHNRNHVWSAFGSSHAKLGKVTQKNTAETLAIADVESTVRQVVQQLQVGGGADQDAAATQSARITQGQKAVSTVSQARVTNVNAVSIPLYGSWNRPLEQSNHVSAVSAAYATSAIEQTINQSESGAGIEWHASATQDVVVNQSGGTATSGASQSDRTNSSGWRGVVTPPGSTTSTPPGTISKPPGGLSGNGSTPSVSGSSAAGGASDVRRVRLAAAPASGRRVFAPRHGTVKRPAIGLRTSHGSAGPSILPQAPASTSAPSRSQSVATGPSATAGQAPLPFKHDNLNFGGMTAAAPGGLLPAAFAVRPEPIELAAPGVGRLQRDAPILGRSVDTSLRERPG
jgi:hypothetical protein